MEALRWFSHGYTSNAGCWGQNENSGLVLSCALNYSAASFTCAKRNPRGEEMHFLYGEPKGRTMPSICESQGKERQLHTSQDTLIISAVLKWYRPPFLGGWAVSETWLYWLRTVLDSRSHVSPECLGQARNRTKVVGPAPQGTPWTPHYLSQLSDTQGDLTPSQIKRPKATWLDVPKILKH